MKLYIFPIIQTNVIRFFQSWGGQPQEESSLHPPLLLLTEAHEGEMHRGTHPLREAWIVTFDPTCGGKPVRAAVLSLKKTGYQLPGKKTNMNV